MIITNLGLSLHHVINDGLDAPCKVSAHKRTIARSILLRIIMRFIGTQAFPDLAECSPTSFLVGLLTYYQKVVTN
jgi:hypothetical protein